MPEESTKEAMNAAIRGARERHGVPRSIAPEPPPQPVARPDAEPQAEPEKPAGRFGRLFGRK
jgi:hypothetical protein